MDVTAKAIGGSQSHRQSFLLILLLQVSYFLTLFVLLSFFDVFELCTSYRGLLLAGRLMCVIWTMKLTNPTVLTETHKIRQPNPRGNTHVSRISLTRNQRERVLIKKASDGLGDLQSSGFTEFFGVDSE